MSALNLAAAASVITASLLGNLSAEPATLPCDCPAFVESNLRCYQALWTRFAGANPTTQDELEVQLDAMWEGVEAGVDPSVYGCPPEPAEQCYEECMGSAWNAYLDLANTTGKPHERWGAITLVFGAYMDVGAPEEVLPVLEAAALDFLERPRDVLTTEAVLRMMKFYRFHAEPLNSTLLELMESEPVLVRELAFQRFTQYTGCKLPFRSDAGAKKRARQVGKIRHWWSAREGRGTAENPN